MSETITFPKPSGATYLIPDVGDFNWGQAVTDFLVAIPNGTVPTSGTFTLTGDLSWGTSFGLLSKYFASLTANPATAGAVRLAHADAIDWRNNANSANLPLTVNSSDQLTFNGSILSVGSSITTIAGTANQVSVSGGTGPTATISLPSTVIVSEVKAGLIVPITSNVDFQNSGATQNCFIQCNPSSTFTLNLPQTQGGSNTFLKNDGSGTLSWDTAGGGGSGLVIGVTSVTDDTSDSTASGTFVTAPHYSITLTPASTSSRFVIQATGVCAGGTSPCQVTLLRGSSNLSPSVNGFGFAAANGQNNFSMSVVDSPATASPVTYSIGFLAFGAMSSVNISSGGDYASTITVTELAS